MEIPAHVAELTQDGFTVLRAHLPAPLLEACGSSVLPTLHAYFATHEANRGPFRHCLPMPFNPPCFAPEFFFDPTILAIVRALLDNRIVADQWHCDAPTLGSQYQLPHVDYARPLFPSNPDLELPPYMLVVSFGLRPITRADGPIEIAPGTHRLPRAEALEAVASGTIPLIPIFMGPGDVLIRHPWALHRGTPNLTPMPRPLLTIRYVRHWYADASREVNAIPESLYGTLTTEQQAMLRFPVRGGTQ